jgi:hypothetical protein
LALLELKTNLVALVDMLFYQMYSNNELVPFVKGSIFHYGEMSGIYITRGAS